jgi:hypothetical protein
MTEYFENKGEENTERTLQLAYERAQELGIKELALATTTGKTAYMALEICKDMKIVAVSYHAGFKGAFKLSLDQETIDDLRSKGASVVCATHALSGVERGLSKKHPGPYPVLMIADTLRLFGQGTKVAIEVMIMAVDSGSLSGERMISVGGSSKGCDTALVLTPVCQSDFFDMKVHEIICKPNRYNE